ncbi:MAG TPA: hypothetical protein DEG92_07905 [Rikenellaceae bacterium]|nr:hypothetical protein [Rikenellaceae bacterium]
MEYNNSYLLTPGTAGNQPSREEIDYIATYLNRQLCSFEALYIGDNKQLNLHLVVARARSIERAVADLLSPDGGNYQGLIENLNKRLNFEERLARFLSTSIALLDYKTNRLLTPRCIVSTLAHDPKHGYSLFDLDEYLKHLEGISTITKAHRSFPSILIRRQFVETANMLVDYLAYLIGFPSTKRQNKINTIDSLPAGHEISPAKCRLIFLLRDTLLLYLGARRLQSAGMAIDARGAMINRAVVQSFTPDLPNNPIYAELYNSIYRCLSTYKGTYSSDYVDIYTHSVRQIKSESVTRLLHFIRQYINRLCGQESGFLAVDIAAHGTMPLLAMTASNTIKKFQMYTGIPWLQEFYCEVIYRPDFPYMRMLESLVCQEELFRFSRTSDDRIIIKETRDPVIQALAAFEIGYFIDLVNARFLQ